MESRKDPSYRQSRLISELPKLSPEVIYAVETARLNGSYPDAHEIVPNLLVGNERFAGVAFPFEREDQELIKLLAIK